MDKDHSVKAPPQIYNTAFQKAPVPLIIVDNDLVIIDLNENAMQLTGFNKGFIDKALIDIFKVQNVNTSIEFVIALNKPEPLEADFTTEILNLKGPEAENAHFIINKLSFWEEGYLIQLDKKLDVNDYLKAFIDLLDQKTNNFFQAVVNTSMYPFCIFDLDNFKFIIRNKAHLDLSGRVVPSENFTDMPFLVDSSVPYSAFIETMTKIRSPYIEKHEYLAVDGQKIYFEIHGFPVFTSDNRHFIILHYRDITKEITLERSVQDLTSSLEDLLTNLPGMIFRCLNESNWTMEYVSEGCKNLTGYNPDELINNAKIKFGDLIYPADRQRVWNSIQDAVRKNKYYEIKYRVVNKKNIVKWVAERGRGSYDANGQVVAIEGFITDISEGKNAELKLKKELRISEAIANISMELLKDTVTPIKVSKLVQDYVKEITEASLL